MVEAIQQTHATSTFSHDSSAGVTPLVGESVTLDVPVTADALPPPPPSGAADRSALFSHYADVLGGIEQKKTKVSEEVERKSKDVVDKGQEQHEEAEDKLHPDSPRGIGAPHKKKKPRPKQPKECRPTSLEELRKRIVDEAKAEKDKLTADREAQKLTLHMKVAEASSGLTEPGMTLDRKIADTQAKLGKDVDDKKQALTRQAAPEQAKIDAQLQASEQQITGERDAQVTRLGQEKARDLAAIEAVRAEAERTATATASQRAAILADGQSQAQAARAGAAQMAWAIPDQDKQNEVRAEGEQRAQQALAAAAAKAQALAQRENDARAAERDARAQAVRMAGDADTKIAAVKTKAETQLTAARTAAKAPLAGRIDQAEKDMRGEVKGLAEQVNQDPSTTAMNDSAAAGAKKAQDVEDAEVKKLEDAFQKRLDEVDTKAQKLLDELDAPGEKDLCKLEGEVDDAVDEIDGESDLADEQAAQILLKVKNKVQVAIAKDLAAVRDAGARAMAVLNQQAEAVQRQLKTLSSTAAGDFAGLGRQGVADVKRLGDDGKKAVQQEGLGASLDLWGNQHKTMAKMDQWMYGHDDTGSDEQKARLARRRAAAGADTAGEVDEEIANLRAQGALTPAAIEALEKRKEHEHKLEMKFGVNITNDTTPLQRRTWSDKELTELDHALNELPVSETLGNKGDRLEFRREAVNGTNNAMCEEGGLVHMYDKGARIDPATGEIMLADKADPSEKYRERGHSAMQFGKPTFMEEVLLHEMGHNTHFLDTDAMEAYKKALGWRTGLGDKDLPEMTETQKADLAAGKPVNTGGLRYVRDGEGKYHCYNGDRIDQTMTADDTTQTSGYTTKPNKKKDELDYREYFAELHKEAILHPELVQKQYTQDPEKQLDDAIKNGLPQAEIDRLRNIRDAKAAEFEVMRHDVFKGDVAAAAAEKRLQGTVTPEKLAAFKEAAAKAMTPEQVARLEAEARQ